MGAESNPGPDRVEELLRVNAELADEVRSLTAGRRQQPRSGAVPAARAVARLHAERDQLAERLEQTEARLAALQADRDGLERQNRELAAAVARLSAGLPGVLRRIRGRLLNG
jgi:chromosome segregation ATPase